MKKINKNNPAIKNTTETDNSDENSAMEQLIKDKTGDDQKIKESINKMGIAVNKNAKKTEKLTSKHTFSHNKVNRSFYITKK